MGKEKANDDDKKVEKRPTRGAKDKDADKKKGKGKDEEELIAEGIVDKRTTKGKTEYFIKWKGKRSKDNSWEDAEWVQQWFKDVVKEYNAKSKSKSGKGASKKAVQESSDEVLEISDDTEEDKSSKQKEDDKSSKQKKG